MPNLLDRLTGVSQYADPRDAAAARRAGLLRLGTSLLAAGGPTQQPVGLGQGLGMGLEAGRTAAAEAEQKSKAARMDMMRRQVLGAGLPFSQTVQALAMLGDVPGATAMADISSKMAGAKPMQVDLRDRVALIDPQTREVIDVLDKGADPTKDFDQERALANDFEARLSRRGLPGLIQTVRGALSDRARAREGDAAAQVNMLYAFITAMDPKSVVREGELALIRSAEPLIQQAQVWIKRNLEGQPVAIGVPILEQMADLMERRLADVGVSWDTIRDQFIRRADRWGVSHEAFEPFRGLEGMSAPAENDPMKGLRNFPPPGGG
jgi:hypothetical protein